MTTARTKDALDGSEDACAFEFAQGVTSAMDPTNAAAVRGGRAVTTLRSHWLHLRCATCGHTFRPGDEVWVSTSGEARHLSVALPCAGSGGNQDVRPEDAEAFFQGLDVTWPPPRDLPVVRLTSGHPLLAPPRAGFKRRICAVCGHTLRANDQVLVCPCRPGAPMCMVAIHRDPVHGLHCWEAWNPGAYRQHCPATSRKLDG